MKMNLQSYVRIYSNILESDACDQTLKELQTVNWQKHAYSHPLNYHSNQINGDRELDVTNDLLSTSKHVESKIFEAYKDYVIKLNMEWFQGWKTFSDVRYNRYSEGQLMNLHCDHINSLFDGKEKGVPVLTALGALNNDYEGGQLEIFQDRYISLKKGDIVVFPSNFLFPHRVLPVTKGTRYSYVCWAW